MTLNPTAANTRLGRLGDDAAAASIARLAATLESVPLQPTPVFDDAMYRTKLAQFDTFMNEMRDIGVPMILRPNTVDDVQGWKALVASLPPKAVAARAKVLQAAGRLLSSEDMAAIRAGITRKPAQTNPEHTAASQVGKSFAFARVDSAAADAYDQSYQVNVPLASSSPVNGFNHATRHTSSPDSMVSTVAAAPATIIENTLLRTPPKPARIVSAKVEPIATPCPTPRPTPVPASVRLARESLLAFRYMRLYGAHHDATAYLGITANQRLVASHAAKVGKWVVANMNTHGDVVGEWLVMDGTRPVLTQDTMRLWDATVTVFGGDVASITADAMGEWLQDRISFLCGSRSITFDEGYKMRGCLLVEAGKVGRSRGYAVDGARQVSLIKVELFKLKRSAEGAGFRSTGGGKPSKARRQV